MCYFIGVQNKHKFYSFLKFFSLVFLIFYFFGTNFVNHTTIMETLKDKIVKRKPGRPSTNASRRSEILEKSTECFIKFGFNKTTLDEIGDAIGFNKAALYYYFKNKEELFVQVVSAQLLNGLNSLKSRIKEIENPEEQLLQYYWNRTKIFVKIINLTGLSGENIIELNDTFNEVYNPFQKNELEFLNSIVKQIKPSKTDKESKEFTNLTFDMVNSLSFTAILLHNVTKKDNLLEDYNSKKEQILKHLIVSYKL